MSRTLYALILPIFLLTACGGEDAETAAGTHSSSPSTPSTTPAEADPPGEEATDPPAETPAEEHSSVSSVASGSSTASVSSGSDSTPASSTASSSSAVAPPAGPATDPQSTSSSAGQSSSERSISSAGQASSPESSSSEANSSNSQTSSSSDSPTEGEASSSSSPASGIACVPGGGEGTDAELPALHNSSAHHHDADKMAEHAAALALVAYEDATHAAVQDGNWCDPGIWHNQSVPGDGARVVIPVDRNVLYNQQDDSRLHTLRVDGQLSFATDTSSRMVLDTLVVDPRGSLNIGTLDNPVEAAARVEIIIADAGDIDVDWDPLLLSRGLILHGQTRIHGAAKTPHMKVATDPRAGDTTLQMRSAPQNWQVGDTLVIAGSRFSGWKWDNSIRAVRYHGTRDEVRTITAINGGQVTLDRALDHHHISPRADLKVSVANVSRNVIIATENADALPAHRRGHVMFMHSQAADIRFAEFFELGRTDKSRTNMEATSLSAATADSNVRGRYPVHFHRTGTSDQRHPAMAVGNAVFGSPGWGYVHHDSHALFHQNVSFNTFGAGFVAETGNETGAWTNNVAIKAEGISGSFNPKNNNDINSFDIARSGDGFWFQGRMVASIGNIAASVNRGFTYFHRDRSGTMIGIPPDVFMLPEALGLSGTAGADDIPIRHFHANEAFASTVGVFVVKANPDQDHDIYTVMSDFTAWEVTAGAAIEYTAHYLLRDFDLIGSTPEPFRDPLFGIDFGTNTTDMVVRDSRIENFPVGIGLGKDHTSGNQTGVDQFVVIGGEMTAVDTPYADRDSSDTIIATSELVDNRFAVDLQPTNSDGYYEYLSPATSAGSGVSFHGSKTDSIGTSPLPAGNDQLGINSSDMIALVAEKGYYRTPEGDAYAIVEEYFSDRATGDIHLRGLKTRLGPEVDDMLGNQYFAWRDARQIGLINLDSRPPLAQPDDITTPVNTQAEIQVLDNDSDPDGDTLSVNRVATPTHGQVFHTETRITYRPYYGFTGTDRFHYWVSDGQGNFDRALVEVTVY